MTWKCIFIDGKYNKNMFYPSQHIFNWSTSKIVVNTIDFKKADNLIFTLLHQYHQNFRCNWRVLIAFLCAFLKLTCLTDIMNKFSLIFYILWQVWYLNFLLNKHIMLTDSHMLSYFNESIMNGMRHAPCFCL